MLVSKPASNLSSRGMYLYIVRFNMWVLVYGKEKEADWLWIAVQISRALECETLLKPFLELIQDYCKNDNQAGDDLFPEFLDPEQD